MGYQEWRPEIQLEDLLIYPGAFDAVVARQADCNAWLASGPQARVFCSYILNPDCRIAGIPVVEVTRAAAHYTDHPSTKQGYVNPGKVPVLQSCIRPRCPLLALAESDKRERPGTASHGRPSERFQKTQLYRSALARWVHVAFQHRHLTMGQAQ